MMCICEFQILYPYFIVAPTNPTILNVSYTSSPAKFYHLSVYFTVGVHYKWYFLISTNVYVSVVKYMKNILLAES